MSETRSMSHSETDKSEHASKTFLGVLRGRFLRVTIVVCLALTGSLAEAAMPIGLGQSVTAMENRSLDALLAAGLLLVSLIVLRVSSSVIGLNVSKAIEIGLSVSLKRRIGEHMVQNARELSGGLDVGEALETAESDTGTLAESANVITSLISSAVTYIVIGCYLLSQQWLIGVIILIAAPILAISMPALVRLLSRRLREHRRLAGAISSQVVDAATGLRTLKGINGELPFLRRYYNVSAQMRQAGLSVAGVRALVEGAKILVPTSVVLLILGIGILQLQAGSITAGQLVTFYGFALFLVAPVSSFINAIQEVAPLLVAKGRIDRLLTSGEAENLADGRRDAVANGSSDAASVIEPGKLTVITSTDMSTLRPLAEELSGFSNTEYVELTSDGERKLNILLAEGDAFLFSGSVRETLGEHPDEELLRAITIAGADDIIDAFPDGLDHRIHENARNLSGGQRQRLNLARAIAANPETLILVNPTTAVDTVSEFAIAQSIAAMRAGHTTITFSDSYAHLSQADKIIIIERGQEIEHGTHHELLAQSATYRNICRREAIV
ncbi:ABC transporter transmembrane domain-containing protein [Plantibacter sp. YIM 135347]|uniref:ABC transporter transmembrane domain-containing protein n=1 Tax=Plantibacter sp. YIM 135347 TaxID=3423919 RepID=UPI003D3360D6